MTFPKLHTVKSIIGKLDTYLPDTSGPILYKFIVQHKFELSVSYSVHLSSKHSSCGIQLICCGFEIYIVHVRLDYTLRHIYRGSIYYSSISQYSRGTRCAFLQHSACLKCIIIIQVRIAFGSFYDSSKGDLLSSSLYNTIFYKTLYQLSLFKAVKMNEISYLRWKLCFI